MLRKAILILFGIIHFFASSVLCKNNPVENPLEANILTESTDSVYSDIEQFIKSQLVDLEKSLSQKDTTSIINTYISLGSYFILHNLDQDALDFFREAHYYAVQKADEALQAEALINTGRAHLLQAHHDSSLNVLRQAELLARRNGRFDLLSTILNEIGLVYFDRHNYNESIRLAEESIIMSPLSNHIRQKLLLGRAFQATQQYYTAKNYINMVLANAFDPYTKATACYTMFELEKETNSLTNALAYMESYTACMDTIMSMINPILPHDLKAKYNQEQLIRYNQLIAASSKEKPFIIGGCCLLLLLITVAVIIVRSRMKKRREQLQINEEKRQDIPGTDKAKEQLLQKSLPALRLRLHGTPDATDRENVLQLIENRLFTPVWCENDWRELEELVNFVYNNFIFKLKNNHPELSGDDTKLCLLLRMRQPHSLIANLLQTTNATLTKRKQRLKDVLKLNSVDDFEQYFNRL